jgi:hypothetical protein
MFRSSAPIRFGLGSLAVALAVAACGSSHRAVHHRAHHPTTTHRSTTTVPVSTAPSKPTDTIMTGPVHATLRGQNHHPVAGKSWHYVVRVTNAAGKPLDGVVTTEFTYDGIVEGKETPPTHMLKDGVLRDTIVYPADAEGHPIDLQTVIKTKEGTVTLDWPVTAVP